MRFDVITIFPHIFDSYLGESILKRAAKKRLIKVVTHNLRDFAADTHRKVDDLPYGGGAGMVFKAEPLLRAAESVMRKGGRGKSKIVLLSAKGKQFNQKMAYGWAAKYRRIIFISGRYEGIDERVRTILRADEVSVGPYVLTDGDVATMVMISAVSRLIPGVIRLESLAEESHWNLLLKKEARVKGSGLEYPHYTRPEVLKWKGKTHRVPRVLLSGNHKKIAEWRRAPS